jgi:hypothetical protein
LPKIRIIFAILLFAFVPARTKIFAQYSKIETTNTGIRNEDINQTLLFEGIDSVLASMSFSRENIEIEVDTARNDTTSFHRQSNSSTRVGKYLGKLIINRFTNFHNTLRNANGIEEGVYSVSASGVLCCLPSGSNDQKFSFTKSTQYRTVYEDNSMNAHQPKSFWDTTAKPVLVTIGAVAVIALFFLIRG